jgi:nucleotide-binding universal stress UspA family protein
MYRKILVGVDKREQSRDALELARLIASRTGAGLVAANVFSTTGIYPYRGDGAWYEEMLGFATKTAEDAIAGGPPGEQAATIASGSPAHGLHELAESEQADLIVVGSAHRSKLGRLVAGSTGLALLNGAPCAVAVAPTGFAQDNDAKLETVGVAYDGHPESETALSAAIDLAQSVGASLRLVTLAYPPERWFAADGVSQGDIDRLLESINEDMRRVQEDALARIPEGVEHSGEVFGDPRVSLADVKDIDLLVMGSRNYGPLRRVLVGSLARQVMASAPWPVVVLPRGARGTADSPLEAADAARGAA